MDRIRQVTQMQLDKRDALSLRTRSPQVLSCVEGELWITFDGRREDIVLAAGENIEFDAECGIVISALQPTRLSLSSTKVGAGGTAPDQACGSRSSKRMPVAVDTARAVPPWARTMA